jgi:hypothetical protein
VAVHSEDYHIITGDVGAAASTLGSMLLRGS